MNKKDLKLIQENLGTQLPPPTESQVQEVKNRIQQRLEEKPINRTVNFGVKEGYTKSLEILEKRELNYDGLKTIQGRAIAAITFDYLGGTCSADVLCNVPIKRN